MNTSGRPRTRGRSRHPPGRYGRLEQLFADIRQRRAGASVLDVFREKNDAMLDELATGTDDDFLALAKVIGGDRALQERLAGGGEPELAALTAVIAESARAAEGDIVPGLVARTVSWIHGTTMNGALAGLLTGKDRAQLAARLRAAADRAYDQLVDGLGDYGKSG